MISLDVRQYSDWDGRGRMVDDEYSKISNIIKVVHSLGKPIRFWATPDGVAAWTIFHDLGVDYINTDNPEACAAFFRDEKGPLSK